MKTENQTAKGQYWWTTNSTRGKPTIVGPNMTVKWKNNKEDTKQNKQQKQTNKRRKPVHPIKEMNEKLK